MRQLQLAQLAWAEPPAWPPGEGRVLGQDQASLQVLGLAVEEKRVSSAELHGWRELEGFSNSLFQTASVKLSEELEDCILRKR